MTSESDPLWVFEDTKMGPYIFKTLIITFVVTIPTLKKLYESFKAYKNC